MWMRLLVSVLVAAAAAQCAPFPAHLVIMDHHQEGHGHVSWQEYPVDLTPVNASSFKPILPGTDHGLYNEGFFEGDIAHSNKHIASDPDTKNAVTDPSLLWPYGTVVYKVDDDVGCPESPQCEILMAAMDHYHENSCIRFKQWTGEDNWVSIFFNSDSSGACWSPVGRVGDGEQRLSLGQRCWYKGIVIHELGHAMGFWHEMNRPDRDDWIYVYWQNIIPGFASAFRKHAKVKTLGENFDYRSIMMYDEYAFSKDGRSPTLQATTGEEIGPIWRKKGLSASDKRRIQKLYNCDPKKPMAGFPYDVNCDFNKHVCGFKNGGSPNWNWRTVNQTDGYVYTSFDTAGTNPGHFMSINFPPTSSALESVRGKLGCVRFYYLIETDGDAQLILDQAYLKTVTQLSFDEDATFELWSNDTATNEWIHMEIPLYVTRPFKLIFTSAFNGSATHGTIALDDVELLYTPCGPNATPPEANQTVILPSAPRPRPPKPKPVPTTDIPATTESTTTTTDSSSSGTTSTASTTTDSTASTDSTTNSETGSTTTPAMMTTEQSEQSIQLQQLHQQQLILQQQQLLEQQQQKEQQALLLAMSHDLQQLHDKHKQGEHSTTTAPTSSTSTTVSSTTDSTTESPGDSTTPFVFPISLNESYDSSTVPKPAQVPNLPDPTDRIPLKNPNPHHTTTTTPNYDVDESVTGR